GRASAARRCSGPSSSSWSSASSSRSTCRPAITPTSCASPRTTTTSSARAVADRPRSTTAASGRSRRRSPSGRAIASTVTGSSCSASARAARRRSAATGPRPSAPRPAPETRVIAHAGKHDVTLSPPLRGILILALLALAVAGCQGGASPSAASTGLRVVTTTTVFADIVQNVGGSRISVTSIIPPGVGPEDYEPKPEDARKLAGAGLIVSNGVGLDDFLDRMLSATGGQAPRLVLGDGIPTLTVNGEQNPHFWLDPSLVRRYYLPAIVGKLSSLDPAGKGAYEAKAAAYAGQLDALDAELKGKVEQIPPQNRKLVTFHDAFPYFARHYGFEQRGLVASVLVGIVCAVMGTFVVLKGLAFIGDAVSHATLPGLVIAYLVGAPLYVGGAIAAVGTSLAIGFVSRRSQLRFDT